MKILINTPKLSLLGGVANHYLGLRNFWTENVRYNTVGKRSRKDGSGIYWLPWDCVKFVYKLLTFKPDTIVVNPSLGHSALKRDFIFMRIAKMLGFNIVVMLHGFDWDYVKTINKGWAVRNFNKASLIFVLANAFREEMIKWGVKTPITFTTTKVDDALVENFDVISARTGNVRNILFLSRIVRAKGVYEAADTYALLKKSYPELTLTFVGDGSELAALKQYVMEKKITDVRFTGALYGEALKNEYKRANFFLFTSYGEGMPTVVLEAMAFGLPVLTRKAGGLADFFEDGKMGYITESLDPKDFAKAMIPYIKNPKMTREVSLYNANYAREHFMASSVARQMEAEIRKIIG